MKPDLWTLANQRRSFRFTPRIVLWLGALSLVCLPGYVLLFSRVWPQGPSTPTLVLLGIAGVFIFLFTPLLVIGCLLDLLSGAREGRRWRQLVGGALAATAIGLAILVWVWKPGNTGSTPNPVSPEMEEPTSKR